VFWGRGFGAWEVNRRIRGVGGAGSF